jgi:signal transduction histidine kinase
MAIRLRRIRHWPLALKLASAVFVLALVPQLVVAVINAEEVHAQLEQREREGLQRRAVEAARRLEERLGRLRAYTELLATNPLVIEATRDRMPSRRRRGSPEARHRATVEAARAWDERHENVHRLLLSARQANPWFQNAYLLDVSGVCISSSERQAEPEMIGRVYDYRPYFRAPIADAEPYVTDVLKNVHTPGTGIFISAPVMSGDEVAAVVVIKIDTGAIADVVAELSARGGRILLVDRFGVVVGDAIEGTLLEIDDPASVQFRPLASVERYRTLFEDTRRYGDALHENYLDRVSDPLHMDVLWQRLRGTMVGADPFSFPAGDGRGDVASMVGYSVIWAFPGEVYGYVVVAQPVDRFLGPLEELVRTSMLRALLVAAGVAVVLALLIRRMSGRVRRLAHATQRVAAGDLSLRLDDRYRDELGELAASFDHMTRELAATIGSMEHARSEAENARTEAAHVRAAKHGFIAKVGRQFRSPIQSIVETTTHLRRLAEKSGETSALDQVASLERSVETLERVVEQMRTLAGDDEVRTERVCVREFLDEVTRAVRPVASLSASKLALDIEDELGELEVDRAKLRQIVFQLLDNAFKFTRHGEVTVAAHRRPADGVSALVLRISDTGIGMTRGQIERFMSEDPADADASGGTGLVLGKLAARAIGAQVEVESEPGRGTTFTISLSLVDTSQSTTATHVDVDA